MSANFPIFEANQVLTAKHLNDLRGYLDGHARETRRWTIGTGIVAGLQLSLGTVDRQPVLNVACGAGISSSGDLLWTEGVQLRYAQVFEDRGRYEPFGFKEASKKDEPDVWQLMTNADVRRFDLSDEQQAESDKQRDAFSTLASQFEEHVVVAYLECWDVDLQFCSLEECTDRGQTRYTELRFLLVPKKYVEDPGLVEDENTTSLVLEIPRVTEFKNLMEMQQRYATACRNALDRFTKVLTDGGYALLDKLVLESTKIAERVQVLETLLKKTRSGVHLIKGGVKFIQVLHDFMRDVAATWNTLVEQAVAAGYQSCPDPTAHPLHLCLGRVGKRGWRHDYRGPLAGGGMHARNALVRTHQKLVGQLVHFQIKPPSGPIMVLGQDGVAPCTSLVPYYYDPDALSELKRVWAPAGLRAAFPDTQVHSWHDVVHGARPLYSHHDNQQFYRVEGILGAAPDVATSRLDRLRTLLKLSFDVVALDDAQSLNEVQLTALAGQRDLARRWNAARRAIEARLLRLGALLDVAELWPELAHAALLPSGAELRNAIEAVEAALAGPASTRAARELRGPERALMSAAAQMLAGLSRSARSLTSEALTSKIVLGPGSQPSAKYLMYVGLLLAHHRAELLRVFEAHAEFDELGALAAQLEREAQASPELLHNFVARHPDLEHGAGVPRGGTFVFVHNGEQVMADFYLPYRWCRCCDMSQDVEVERCIPMVVEAGWAKQLKLLDGMISGAVSVWSEHDARWIELGEWPVGLSWGGRVQRSDRGVLVYPIGDARAWAGARYQPQLVSGFIAKDRMHAQLLEPLEMVLRVVGDDGPIVYRVWLVLLPPLVLAHDDFAVTVKGKPVEIRTLANDVLPPGRHVVRLTMRPSHGELTAIDNELGGWRYAPTPGFTGLDEFRYELRIDGPFGSHASSARVTIHVLECCEQKPVEPPPTPVCEVVLSRQVFCDDDGTAYQFSTRGAIVNISGPGVRPRFAFDFPDLPQEDWPKPIPRVELPRVTPPKIVAPPKIVEVPKIIEVPDWFDAIVDGTKAIRERLEKLPLDPSRRDKIIDTVDNLHRAKLDAKSFEAAVALSTYSKPQVLALARVDAAKLGTKLDDLRVLESVRSTDAVLDGKLSKLVAVLDPADIEPLRTYATVKVDEQDDAAAREWQKLKPTAAQEAAVDALVRFAIKPSDHEQVSTWVTVRSQFGNAAELESLTQIAKLGLSDGEWKTATNLVTRLDNQLENFMLLTRLDPAKQAATQQVLDYHARVADAGARDRLVAAARVGASDAERAAILASTEVEEKMGAALVHNAQLIATRPPSSEELNRYEQALALGDAYPSALALANRGFDYQQLDTMRSLSTSIFAELGAADQLRVLTQLREARSDFEVLGRDTAIELLRIDRGESLPSFEPSSLPSRESLLPLSERSLEPLPGFALPTEAAPVEVAESNVLALRDAFAREYGLGAETVAGLSQLVETGDFQSADLAKARQLQDSGLTATQWKMVEQIASDPDATRRTTLEAVTRKVADTNARATFWTSMKFKSEQRTAIRAAAPDYIAFGDDIRRETTGYIEAKGKLGGKELSAIDSVHAAVGIDAYKQVTAEYAGFVRSHQLSAEQLRRGVAASQSGQLAALRDFERVDPSYRELLASAYASELGREKIEMGLRAAKVTDENLSRLQQGEAILGRVATNDNTRTLVIDAFEHVAANNVPSPKLAAYLRGAKLSVDDQLRDALRQRFALEPLPDGISTRLTNLDPLQLAGRDPDTLQALWWLVHESSLGDADKRAVFNDWAPSTVGVKPQLPVGAAVGAGSVVIGDMALPIAKLDIASIDLGGVELPQLDRPDLRFRLGWEFVPKLAKAGSHQISYECLDAKGAKTTKKLTVKVLAHPQITIRDTLVRKEDKYVIELQAHDALGLLGTEGKDGWNLEWRLSDSDEVVERTPKKVLAKRPKASYELDYRAELVHPELPDCTATYRGKLRWPEARRDLLDSTLDRAKARLDDHATQLTDKTGKAEVEAARDVADLVGTLVRTQEGEERWASADLDGVVLPKFERALTRLRSSWADAQTDTLAEAYADTVDVALGFVHASHNAPTDNADKLLTQIQQDVVAHEGLKTEQLRTRLTELRDDPDANPKLVERAHALLKEWPDR